MVLIGIISLPTVSALAAEWIEIQLYPQAFQRILVSALAAEWIEIHRFSLAGLLQQSLRPRGGVD